MYSSKNSAFSKYVYDSLKLLELEEIFDSRSALEEEYDNSEISEAVSTY